MAEKRSEFVGWQQKRGEPMTGTGQRVVVKPALKLQKEWQIGDGESDWGIISRVTK